MTKWVLRGVVLGSVLLISGCGFNFCSQTSSCATRYNTCNTGCNTSVSYTATCANPCAGSANICDGCNDWYEGTYY